MSERRSTETNRDDTRTRIITAAIALLNDAGREAVTTRAVADAAGVQAPTIYRLFGDKTGLLHAVATYGFEHYLSQKRVRKPSEDPVADLRIGWDLHMEFGLKNPAIYSLMFGDPVPGSPPPAAAASRRVLEQHIRRIAVAGRLRVSEARAADLVHAAGCGTVMTLLAMPVERRDPSLSHAARDAVLAAITSDAPARASASAATAAVQLRAVLPETNVLSDGERALLAEWLDRLAAAP